MESRSPHTPRSILDAFYDAERIYMSAKPAKRDFSIVAKFLAPNVRVYQSSALPYGGTYEGIEGFQNVFRQMAEVLSVVDVYNTEFFESEHQGSNRIMVLSTVHFKYRKSGEEVAFPLAQAITVDLELGIIKEIRPFYWDVKSFNEGIGYSP